MPGSWAAFAKNLINGPGWIAVGSGTAGVVYSSRLDGELSSRNGSVPEGDWNLGLLGDVGNVHGSGVTVLPQSTVDGECALFVPVYEAILQERQCFWHVWKQAGWDT